MTSALEGVRVLDCTRALAGPYCCAMLADMGADVVKVERPGRGDDSRRWGPPFLGGESYYFLSVNRNKRSLTLDFAVDEGKALFRELVAAADVVVENFRPGSLARLGLGAPAFLREHDRLVWCSITGFGSTGPEAERPGYDIIAQGMGGMMSITGAEGGPPLRPGVASADVTTGMYAAQGILLALFHRERTGQGQHVDASLLEGQMALMTYQAGRYHATGESPRRLGNRHPSIAPYDCFPAADGWINVAVGNDELWERFCAALGLEELAADPRFSTNPDRVENLAPLTERITARTRSEPVEALRARLDAVKVPNGPVWNMEQLFESPQAKARDMVLSVEHPTAGPIGQTGFPFKLSETPGALRMPPPLLGEHTAQVLAEWLAIDDERLQTLRGCGAV